MTLVYISAHGADHIAASGGESNPTEIEKMLKALLVFKHVEFARTHNLSYLAGLLEDTGLRLPFSIDEVEQLVPFGVALRYDFLDTDAIDRIKIRSLVQKIRGWVEGLVENRCS